MKSLLLLVLLAAGCGSSNISEEKTDKTLAEKQEAVENIDLPDEVDLPFRVLHGDAHGNFDERTFTNFTSSKDYENALNTINKTRKPGIMTPEIDFSKRTVALLAMGQQTTGGYSIKANRVELTDRNIIVYYQETYPDPRSPVTMALTSPWTMIEFENNNLPVIFVPLLN